MVPFYGANDVEIPGKSLVSKGVPPFCIGCSWIFCCKTIFILGEIWVSIATWEIFPPWPHHFDGNWIVVRPSRNGPLAKALGSAKFIATSQRDHNVTGQNLPRWGSSCKSAIHSTMMEYEYNGWLVGADLEKEIAQSNVSIGQNGRPCGKQKLVIFQSYPSWFWAGWLVWFKIRTLRKLFSESLSMLFRDVLFICSVRFWYIHLPYIYIYSYTCICCCCCCCYPYWHEYCYDHDSCCMMYRQTYACIYI